MSIKITTDSTADLTPELLERYQIEVIPLTINLGDKGYRDGLEISRDDIFRHVDAGGDLPKTSAVSVAEFHDCFTRLSPLHEAVINVDIGSKMSACYQNACIAAEEFDNVYVIDSGSLSAGQGLVAVAGAIAAASGMEPRAVVEYMKDYAARVETTFTVDRLDYLCKGGRCSAVAAMGANLLRLKPCIEAREGALAVGKKYRGSFTKALCDYARDRIAGRDDLDLTMCCVAHPDAPREAVETVMDEIRSLAPFQEVVEVRCGSTVSSHCGPATVGIMFAHK